MSTDQIDIIVKIPIGTPYENVMEKGEFIIEQILKKRDWQRPHERKIIVSPTDKPEMLHTNYIEFKMTLYPDMEEKDLTNLALNFARWLRDPDHAE